MEHHAPISEVFFLFTIWTYAVPTFAFFATCSSLFAGASGRNWPEAYRKPHDLGSVERDVFTTDRYTKRGIVRIAVELSYECELDLERHTAIGVEGCI